MKPAEPADPIRKHARWVALGIILLIGGLLARFHFQGPSFQSLKISLWSRRQYLGIRFIQGTALQHPAKLLLGGLFVFAIAGMDVGDALEAHPQAFELNDAEVFVPALPDLALS